MSVDLNLEMQVRTSRQTCGADLADDLARRDPLTGGDVHTQQVAVEQPHVLIDLLGDVDAGAARVESSLRDAFGRSHHRGAARCREVDTGMDVQAGAKRIKRLQRERSAAKRQRLDRAGYDGGKWQPLLAGDSRPRHRPHQ